MPHQGGRKTLAFEQLAVLVEYGGGVGGLVGSTPMITGMRAPSSRRWAGTHREGRPTGGVPGRVEK
jgi:hypothetical protein